MKGGLDMCLLNMGIVVQFQVGVDRKPSTSPVKTNFSTTREEKIGMEEKRHTQRERKNGVLCPGKYDVLVDF